MKLKYITTPEIKALGIRSTVVAEVHEVKIDDENSKLEVLKNQALEQVLKLSNESIQENPVLESYRELVRGIGRSLKKFPPAAESLLQSIRRTEHFPRINTAVDCYNIVVSQTYLALGVHDIDKLGDSITFRLSDGQEPFVSVGSSKVKNTQPGDFVYSDESKILAWLDSKDSDLVKLSTDTKNIVIVIQGTHYTSRDYNLAAAERACTMITEFCGGTYEVMPVE